MHSIEQEAYILHTRPFRETSLLIETFTKDFGRLSMVAKGVRSAKNHSKGLLQPFVPLFITYYGKRDLLNLKSFESRSPMHYIKGRRLMSAFYLNELLIRLLQPRDPFPELFEHYQVTLNSLVFATNEEMSLRLFEKQLLRLLGYELPLIKEVHTGENVLAEALYSFDPLKGPTQIKNRQQNPTEPPVKGLFFGKSLLSLAENQLTDPLVLKDAKRILRNAIALHLGNKPLESRKLWFA